MRYPQEQHYMAFGDALIGVSSKDSEGRGFGLRTSVRIILEELEGEVLAV